MTDQIEDRRARLNTTLKAVQDNPGVYIQSLSNFASKIEIMERKDVVRVTLDLPLEDVLGDRLDVRDLGKVTNKFVPTLAFFCPSELAQVPEK